MAVYEEPPEKQLNISDLNSTFLELYVNPANERHMDYDNFNISKLNFTWEVVQYEGNLMQVQLVFYDYPYVSSDQDWDQFFIRFKKNEYFKSKTLDSTLDYDSRELTFFIKP